METAKVNISQKLKTFMIVNESYKCPANCPYCTAKITKWEATEHNWEIMREHLQMLREHGVKFEYLTISGNGEPALMSYDRLKFIRDVYDEFQDLFDYGRFQTCGEIFKQQDKWELFKDFSFEITRCDIDPVKNGDILGYTTYDELENFKKSKVIFNYVLMKENFINPLKGIEDIKTLFSYDNVYMVSAKILNVNTLDEKDASSKYSKWIIEHGVAKQEADTMVELFNNHFTQHKEYDTFLDRFEWVYENKQLMLYARRQDYGIVNIVYYNGKLTDYHFKSIELVK